MSSIDEGVLFYLQNAKTPNQIATATQTALENIIQSINYLDETNFPNTVNGNNILATQTTDLDKLTFREWPFPLFKSMPTVSASGTTGVTGGYFFWDPVRFPGGSWYLEAVLLTDSGGVATLSLMSGTTTVASVNTSKSDAYQLVRSSAAITMPTSSSVLTCKLTNSSSSYYAYCLGASMIYVP